MAAGRSQLVGRDRSMSSLRGYHTTTAGTGASKAGSLASHSGRTASWSSSTVAKDGGTRPAEVRPLHSVWGPSLEAIRVLPQAARLSHPLACGLAGLTVMRGLSAAPRCSAAGSVPCAASTFDAALAALCAALRRSAAKCDQLQPTAVDCAAPALNLPRYSAANCGELCCSCAAPALLWVAAARLRSTALLPLRPPPSCATATPPPRLRAIWPLPAPPPRHRALRRCWRRAAAPPDPRMRRRLAHGAAAAPTPLRSTRPFAAASPTAPLDPPVRRRHHRGAGVALTRRCCATWPAHAPDRQRCSALPLRCPRAASHARPSTRHSRVVVRTPAVQRVLPPLRVASSPRCVTHRSPPRRSLTARRRAACSPLAAAPLAHRSPPRRSRGLLAAAPPASALITDCAARSAPARSTPADAPHATSPPALRLTYGAARSLLPVASRRSICTALLAHR